MSYRTVEVEIDHGHILAKDAESLPERASGLLTIFKTDAVNDAAIPQLQALESLQNISVWMRQRPGNGRLPCAKPGDNAQLIPHGSF
jgi:hypothetical protein